MRIFVTGATGFIGNAVVRELLAGGHQVTGLCRSPDKAAALAATGATVLNGSVQDAATLRAGAAQSDAVIHLAFNHDFSTFAANCAEDRGVIATLGGALAGSQRPLIVTSGTAIASAAAGEIATEQAPALDAAHHPRAASEEAAREAAAQGANVSIVRLPQVHDTTRQGLVSYVIEAWRRAGSCAYVGDGSQRWAAAHLLDVARLYRLAVERAAPGAVYHAVGEPGVTMKAIAETMAPRLGLPLRSITPAEAGELFGWLAMFAGTDMPASSALTQQLLGWQPAGPTLLEDLAAA